MLEANAVPAFMQLLKVPAAAESAGAEAAANAAVALGVLCCGRPPQVATATAAGCIPRLLNMLRSTQVRFAYQVDLLQAASLNRPVHLIVLTVYIAADHSCALIVCIVADHFLKQLGHVASIELTRSGL